MNKQQLIADIQKFCRNNSSASNITKYKRYFKEGLYNGWGLSGIQMKDKAKALLKTPGVTLEIVLNAAPYLLKNGKFEESGIIMLLVGGLHKHYTRDTFCKIETWYSYSINNWAHADALGMQIIPVFLKKGLIQIADLEPWLTAKNKYQRRSVPVTLIKSLKTHENYPDLFAFLECLMTDPEREVHQGVGWFLREAWKKKPLETEAFLFKWKEVAPRLIFQYATEKMTAEEKKRFRRSK